MSIGASYCYICVHTYRRTSFLRATNFVNGLKKEVRGNYFHESILVSSLQSAICVMIEFPLIFSEKKFVEVSKIHEIHKISSPRKSALQ